MKIERFEVPGLAQYSYIVSDSGLAVVIDPIRDIDRYLDYAAANSLRITHILETHIHADFASGSLALAQATSAQLALSAHDHGEHYTYAMPHLPLADGDSIQFSSARLQAIHTPGHTPEHLSFLLFDQPRSASEPVVLFSGDFLFVGSLGRPDLLGEEARLGLARQLLHSLQHRIASLPDSLQVLPGHGAGSLCGAGLGERPETTLGYERATNPFFRLPEADFVHQILASVPPMPDYYPRMKQLNAQGAPPFETLPPPAAFTPAELATQLAARPEITLLDLRRPEAFGGAHIPGSINIGAGQNLSLWAGWLLAPTHSIVLITDSGDDPASRRALARVGLDNVPGFLAAGMTAWIAAGLDFARIPQQTVAEVDQFRTQPSTQPLIPSPLILDVRSDQERLTGSIPGSHHLMLGNLPAALGSLPDTLPRDRPIVTVCGSGYRSSIAASLLARAAFPQVSSMAGGMTAWNAQKLPLE